MQVPERMLEKLEGLLGRKAPTYSVSRAPGRIEVLGNHVDYNGGIVLSTTVDRFVWSLGVKTDEIIVHSMNVDDTYKVERKNIAPVSNPEWYSYTEGIYWAFKRRNHNVLSATSVISGDVPIGSGLGSSAALEVSLTNLVARLSGINLNPRAMAMIAFEAERLYCQVSCGIMDQFTSQLGRPESLLGIYCANLQVKHIPWPNDVRLVVSDSGVSRSALEPLNERRSECQAAVRQLIEGGFEINNLSEIGPHELNDVNDLLSERLFRRVRHVVEENVRVVQGMTALNEGNSQKFGELMFESHKSSRDLYEVSHESLDLLVSKARDLSGVLGSRLTGAGLGGSTITMVKERHLSEFVKEIESEYEREAGNRPSLYVAQIPGGVVVEEREKE